MTRGRISCPTRLFPPAVLSSRLPTHQQVKSPGAIIPSPPPISNTPLLLVQPSVSWPTNGGCPFLELMVPDRVVARSDTMLNYGRIRHGGRDHGYRYSRLTRLLEATVSALTTNNPFVFLWNDALQWHLLWQAFNHAYHSHNANTAHKYEPSERVIMRTITDYMARFSAGMSFPYRLNSLSTPHLRRAPSVDIMHYYNLLIDKANSSIDCYTRVSIVSISVEHAIH